MKSALYLAISMAGILILAACNGEEPTSSLTPTATPGPTLTPTAPPSPTPDLALDPQCFATEAYSLEHLVAVIGQDTVPTAFDAVNRGGCQFRFPITQITVELSGEEANQTAVIPLAIPTNEIEFPLPSTLTAPLIDPALPAGRYERTVIAATGDRSGPTAVIPGFEPVILVGEPESLVAKLLRAQSRWERSGITSYTYRAAWNCFCVREYIAQVDVQVVNGQVTKTAFAEPGFTGDVPDPQRFGTVANLFSFIEDAIARNAFHINARFHPDLGYPTETFVDYDELLADEEQGFTVLTMAAN